MKTAALVAICLCFAFSGFIAVSAQDHQYSSPEIRSYYTAPPLIPHEANQRNSQVCMACHSTVLDLGDRVSIQTPHPEFTNCLQCHLPLRHRIVSVLESLDEPRKGLRVHAFAPPIIPHRNFLREKCLACHSPNSPREYMRFTHPERINCRQCHLTDQRAKF